MGLNISNMLTPSRAPFYGIVLGNAATPLGSAVLPDSFGTKDNYHTEYIKFEMAVFESSYHAILGRPALAKFIAYDCDQEAIEYTAISRMLEPSAEVFAAAQKLTDSEMEISSQRLSQSRVKPNNNNVNIKDIQLEEGDSSKTALIRGSLSDK
ncbi:uncharacterized protein LOC112903572 [Panicum hallii]|uniref:uncharacterized protein LOC112903572 n=1 Tax=Panicum hallii TaxID=206008 RepID=UPI000DF4E31F|nr:uncharacterized protein LOC112903572 [Panicum hallii]